MVKTVTYKTIYVAILAVVLAVAATLGVAYLLRPSAAATPAPLVKGSGVVDVGFLQSMALHHDQAVVMAKLVQGRASNPINLLAEQIASNQLLEIGEMKGWLKMWEKPLVPTSSAMAWMNEPSQSGVAIDPVYMALCRSSDGMPGMATSEELESLRKASGRDVDKLFLKFMIRHHQGAFPMLTFAAANASSQVVRSAAKRMGYEQRREVSAMKMLLMQMGEKPLPFMGQDS